MNEMWAVEVGYIQFLFDEQDKELRITDRQTGKRNSYYNVISTPEEIIPFARGYMFRVREGKLNG